MDISRQGGKLGRRKTTWQAHVALDVSGDGSLPRLHRKWSDSGSLLKAEV